MSKKKKKSASSSKSSKQAKRSKPRAGKIPARPAKALATEIPESREQLVWEYLDRNGFDKALVYFEGGGDDGAATRIALVRTGQTVAELNPNVPLNLRDTRDPPIEWLLQEPIYEAYVFEGEHHFADVITWSAKTRQLEIPDNGFRY